MQAAWPDRKSEVVNCGGISYASYRLVPILEEVLNYEPDLIVVYTGHNEFLEDRSYTHLKQRSPWIDASVRFASRFRTYNVVWSQWNRWNQSTTATDNDNAEKDESSGKPVLPTEVWGRLDGPDGLQQYHHDKEWHNDVTRHFEFNLRRMVAMCHDADVPIWFAKPVANLRNSPPFKSEHRADLRTSELKQWEALRNEATALYGTDMPAAIRKLLEADTIDDQHAGLAYDLAKCYETVRDPASAKQYYVAARDRDVCPLRMTSELYEALDRVCAESRVPLIDVMNTFESLSPDGIPGGFLLVDHVHPSIPGHRKIAELLMEQIQKSFDQQMTQDWQQTRDELYDEHLGALSESYYLDGQRRLEALRAWAQGRANGVMPTE